MKQQNPIGERVREAIRRAYLDEVPRDAVIAERVRMKPDAFSRSMNGGRAFSSLEIARLGDLLNEDVHWLITGEPDPYRVVFAARHDFDPETGNRHVPGRDNDEKTLEGIRLAYTQAAIWLTSHSGTWHEGTPLRDLPADPAEVRALLGAHFVGSFADRLEEVFGVETIRVQGLSTDYSFTLAGRRIIVLTAQSNWFRSNYSLAHELAHLALGHHDITSKNDRAEAEADAFATELLLPAADVRAINWEAIDEAVLARRIWEWGVSTQAVRYRLMKLGLPTSAEVASSLSQITQRLLRRHPSATSAPVQIPMGESAGSTIFAVADPISTRMKHAAEPRIPARLIKHHLDGVAAGRINKATLAWLLNTPVDELEVDEPAPVAPASMDELMADFGLAADN